MRLLLGVGLALLMGTGIGRAHDEKASKMVLKVAKEQVAAAEKALSGLRGIKAVKYDQEQNLLTIYYHKPTLGCCSRIHAALKEAGVEYTLVSNQEYPACKSEKEHSSSEGVSPHCRKRS
ncbi:MAG: glutathione S-transferase N-terminal domain-containing protein [Bacteroidia bacterium]